MFVETKREGEATADIWALPNLISWLEGQPAAGIYCYLDNGRCLIAQYLKYRGWKRPSVGSRDACDYDKDGNYGPDIKFPRIWGDISYEHPRTFGAALERARAALSGG